MHLFRVFFEAFVDGVVHIHVQSECDALVGVIEVLVQIVELEEAIRHKVVFDTLVLKITIHYFDELQVCQCEADQLIGGLILVEGDH